MEPQRPAVARKDHRLSTESLVSDKGAPPLSEAAVRDVALRIDLPAPPAPAPRRTSGRVASVAPETKAALSRAKRYGREVLGRRVRVFWHEEQTWYTGRVKDFTEMEALGHLQWEPDEAAAAAPAAKRGRADRTSDPAKSATTAAAERDPHEIVTAIVCDGCEGEFELPDGIVVPEGDWFCAACAPAAPKSASPPRKRPRQGAAEPAPKASAAPKATAPKAAAEAVQAAEAEAAAPAEAEAAAWAAEARVWRLATRGPLCHVPTLLEHVGRESAPAGGSLAPAKLTAVVLSWLWHGALQPARPAAAPAASAALRAAAAAAPAAPAVADTAARHEQLAPTLRSLLAEMAPAREGEAAAAAAARSHRAVPVLRIVIDAMRRSVLSPVASNVASSEEVAVAACACLASTNPRAGAAAAALIDALCAAGSETVPSHFRAISKTVPTEAAGLLCSLLESPSIGGKQSPYFGAVDGAAASATLAEALPPLLRLRPKRPAADGVLILQGALLSCAEARGLLDGRGEGPGQLTATSRAALAASCGELAAWAERHRASGHASLGSGFRHAQARLAGPE
ncbi:hypothetical protein EMIHUDRAFT_461047 [Emiliania huxleyi CCMP1516]|uniref:PHD-type domain-containing protein n=2 Tax=Emiliania huxleyi TaxID=2903 RepID=A0A0D3L1T9_EMIH1|nr:hypothetical protein EMIHUDRAFT_461047 [Emiliania huxleyi CCMP1516]EOD41974.1 hypothetical protein EMIHUDRAFT_461047 [Emiliania huxleyi CCMP1516]|eukprot:XP_005794403.1 hypothetical protein EMIHUDRAFT_461047 [Emiliania huxleyi CCMP1516]